MKSLTELIANRADAVRDEAHYGNAALRYLHGTHPKRVEMAEALRHRQISARAEIKLLDKAIEYERSRGAR